MRYRNEAKKDCKLYNEEKHECKGLKQLYCEIEEKPCSFYKTKEKDEGGKRGNDK